MKRRSSAGLTAIAVAAAMLAPAAEPAAVNAAPAEGYAVSVSDGVDFDELEKGSVYYGRMKHPQLLTTAYSYVGEVTQWEESETPILWRVMGEEQDENGEGDGRLALMSEYILNTSDFNEDKSIVNDYAGSYMSDWLNDEDEGFLSGSRFTEAEKGALVPSEVVTAQFTADGEEIDGTASSVMQKVYLPWGTKSEHTDTFPSVYWSASQLPGKNLIASSLRGQGATLKGKSNEIRYWLRSPVAGTTGNEYAVDRTGTSSSQYSRVFSQYLNAQLGLRPVTKLDKEKIVFASKITSQPENGGETAAVPPHLAAGEDTSPHYKLTVVDGSGALSLGVSNYSEDEAIPVTMGDDIVFAVNNISDMSDTTVNYKAVMEINGDRMIVSSGAAEPLSADSAELSVPSGEFLRTTAETDTVDLYIWLQKNSDYSSNSASEPLHFEVSMTGGEPSELPTPKPEELPKEIAETIKLTYPDGKLKAAIFSFDDLADYHYLSDKHLLDIFNEHGIKSAFNMITSLVSEGGLAEKNIGLFEGHEIASHSVTHPHLDEISTEELLAELNDSKAFINELTGQEAAGLAYPYYYFADTEHLQYVKDAGYRYSRRTDPSGSFDIPESFYNWNPTMHVLWNGGVTDGPYVLPQKTKEFTELEPDEEVLFFIWGHSTDFGNFEGASNYDPETDNWYLIEDCCESIAASSDTIWNPTVIDYVDYVNSQRLLGIYKGSGNNILFDNTKGTKDVWVSIAGEPAVIEAGAAKEIDPGDIPVSTPEIPVTSPESSPEASPEASPEGSPEASPEASPENSPEASPEAPSGPALIMQCGFEDGETLDVSSSGTASYEKTVSPVRSSLRKIAPSTASQYTEDAIAANVAAWEAAGLDKPGADTALRLSGEVAADSNTVTIYEGKLPENIALDFSALGLPSFTSFSINAVQDGNSYELIRYDQWSSCYLAGSKTRYATGSTSVWTPHTMIFSGFASDNTRLAMYLNGRLNYTANAANPQGYDSAYVDLGSYYSGIDLSEDVKITLTQTGAGSVYFDNIRLYRYENGISREAGSSFEDDRAGMLPMQNGIRTGGISLRQWLYLSTEKQQQNYGLTGYSTTVEKDPIDPSNKALRGIRGEGSNEYGYDNAVRFRVLKPEEKLEISFRALTNGIYNIAVDIADGEFEDVFFPSESKTAADRIFALNQSATGQFVSSGRYNGKFAADVNWELDKWNDVSIIYDVKENKTSFDINGVTFDITPSDGSLLSSIMASDEEAVTVNIFRPYPSTETYLMIDDVSIKSDGGDPEIPVETPTAPAETPTAPAETPTAPAETPTAPAETPTAPAETPTAPAETPTAPAETPTEKPGFTGEWSSEFYPYGTGYNDALQYPSYVKDLGAAVTANKIVLDHDPMKILSFSLSVSEDGEEYTPVTSVYAGGTEKYGGKQIYRFAERKVRYVKYSPVLLGEHTTQARVSSLVCNETETVSMELGELPEAVNPVAGRVDIPLCVTVTDSAGDTYELSRDGAAFSAGGEPLGGNTLTIERNAGAGMLTVTASDLSNDVNAETGIEIRPRAVIRNTGLYTAEGGDLTGLAPGEQVCLRAEALTSEALGDVEALMMLAAYSGDGTLAGIELKTAEISSVSDYEDIEAAFTLPESLKSVEYIKAFIWDGSYEPLSESVMYSGSGEVSGFADAQLFLEKSETRRIRLSGTAEDVEWESSDPGVAAVDGSGNVTGTGNGTAVITAKAGGRTLASARVTSEPVYVFLCMGQSNMSAMTNGASQEKEPFEVPISEGVLLLNKQNEFEPASHSYGRHTGVVDAGGGTDAGELSMPDRINMTYSFAEDFIADHPGSRIGLIVNSRVGCLIDVFLKGSETGNGFENSAARAACGAVSEQGEFAGILWHQGESNGSDANYTYVFKNIMYDFRTELGDMELPIVAGGLAEDKPVSGNNASSVSFNDRLSAETANLAAFGFASSRYPYVLTVNASDSTNENRLRDESHFSARSQVEFGHRYYDAYMNITNR